MVGFYGISTIIGYLIPNPLYTYMFRYIGFGLVGFYGISTTVGYLMLNTVYTYIKYMFCKHILLITFLNEPELSFLTHG